MALILNQSLISTQDTCAAPSTGGHFSIWCLFQTFAVASEAATLPASQPVAVPALFDIQVSLWKHAGLCHSMPGVGGRASLQGQALGCYNGTLPRGPRLDSTMAGGNSGGRRETRPRSAGQGSGGLLGWLRPQSSRFQKAGIGNSLRNWAETR